MKRLIIMLTIPMLFSCGSDSSSGPGFAPNEEITASTVSELKNATGENNSLYLERTADMPVCDNLAFRQLVFVAETGDFYHCGANNEWLAIDIKGKNGSNGRDGKDGVNGRDGLAGRDGRDGSDGAAAPHVGPYTWIDPATGYKWFAGATLKPTQAAEKSSQDKLCVYPAASPTIDDVLEATMSGFLESPAARNYPNTNARRYWVGYDDETGLALEYTANGAQYVPYNSWNAIQDGKYFVLCVIK